MFNVLGFVGVLLGAAGLINYFRILYQTKDAGHSWYGGLLMFRPDLLTPKGRRLLTIYWLRWVGFVICWLLGFCLAPMLRNG